MDRCRLRTVPAKYGFGYFCTHWQAESGTRHSDIFSIVCLHAVEAANDTV